MTDRTYLGQGVKFPVQVDRNSGRFLLSGGLDSLRESIYLILMTQRTERWADPEFGSGLTGYAFMDTSPTMLNLLRDDIRRTILTQEPRAARVDVRVDAGEREGCLMVYIDYTAAEGYTSGSLVFPFYLETGGIAHAGTE